MAFGALETRRAESRKPSATREDRNSHSGRARANCHPRGSTSRDPGTPRATPSRMERNLAQCEPPSERAMLSRQQVGVPFPTLSRVVAEDELEAALNTLGSMDIDCSLNEALHRMVMNGGLR